VIVTTGFARILSAAVVLCGPGSQPVHLARCKFHSFTTCHRQQVEVQSLRGETPRSAGPGSRAPGPNGLPRGLLRDASRSRGSTTSQRARLAGQPAGVVTAAEAEDAAKRLATFMSGTAKQPVEALPQKPVGASKPVPAPPQKPVGPTKPVETPVEPAPVKNAPAAAVEPQIAKRRIGLADLRVAAARRRQAAEAS
jgi:hypothetical protein